MRRTWLLGAALFLAPAGACSSDASPAASTPSSSGSVPASSGTGAVSSSTPTTVGPAALDLHSVQWTTIAAPGQACLTVGQIQLHDEAASGSTHYGTALVPDEQHGLPDPPTADSGPKFDRLNYLGDVSYGDADGDGRDEAVVPLGCSNGGGTADGALLYSIAIYTGENGTVQLVGLITPQQQQADVLPTLLSDVRLSTGVIEVEESWYGPNDSTCCPTGKATTTWDYSAGQIRERTSRVTAQPNSS